MARNRYQLHNVISNRDINLTAHRLLLFSVIRPSIEIWNRDLGGLIKV